MNDFSLLQKFFYNFDLIFEEEFNKLGKNIDKLNVIRDVKILLSSSYKSIVNAKKLLASNYLVDSMVVLRSGYETMLKAIGICVDNQIKNTYMLLTQVKFIDSYSAKKNKGKAEPAYVRLAVSKNHRILFNYEYESSDECRKNLSNIYDVLSKFVHPTVLRLYYEKIESDEVNLTNFKKIILCNIYEVSIIFFDFFYTKNNLREKSDAIQSLYGFLFLFNIGTIIDPKEFKKVISKHSKYLYINRNDKYVKEAKLFADEISNLKETEFDKVFMKRELIKITNSLNCAERLLNLLNVPNDYKFI